MDIKSLTFFDTDQGFAKYNCNENLFNISSLNEFDQCVDSRGFAIKFVTDGEERYTINQQLYCVSAGQYLLLNGEKEARVEIDSKKNVKGICINISTAIVQEAVASMARPDTSYADHELASFFYTDHFLENQYHAAHTLLGKEIQSISSTIQQGQFLTEEINTELFFHLAERLVQDQTSVYKELQSIKVVKRATQRDIYRRLVRGREFMDSCYTHPLSIQQVAKEAAMSEFHFFRLFKKVFGIPPHQYIINKRLNTAMIFLKNNLSVSDTAVECGFADVFSFSKCFKKHFGISPSTISRSNSSI